jgi:hypothetical protein
MNDPFEHHGIDHLSPSSINSFVSNPPIWIIRYLFGYRDFGGPAMWRGTCTDRAVGRAIDLIPPFHQEMNSATAIEEFRGYKAAYQGRDTWPLDEAKCDAEEKALPDYVEQACFWYRSLGKPIAYQKRIRLELGSLPVPIIGFIDFQYEDSVRDLKTTARKPSEQISASHSRQMAIYAAATESDRAFLDYVVVNKSRKEIVVREVQSLRDRMYEVEKIALTISRLLSISADKHEIAALFFPDFESWQWSDQDKHFAKTIWPFNSQGHVPSKDKTTAF